MKGRSRRQPQPQALTTPNPNLWFLRLRTPAGIAGARAYTARTAGISARVAAAAKAARKDRRP